MLVRRPFFENMVDRPARPACMYNVGSAESSPSMWAPDLTLNLILVFNMNPNMNSNLKSNLDLDQFLSGAFILLVVSFLLSGVSSLLSGMSSLFSCVSSMLSGLSTLLVVYGVQLALWI